MISIIRSIATVFLVISTFLIGDTSHIEILPDDVISLRYYAKVPSHKIFFVISFYP